MQLGRARSAHLSTAEVQLPRRATNWLLRNRWEALGFLREPSGIIENHI